MAISPARGDESPQPPALTSPDHAFEAVGPASPATIRAAQAARFERVQRKGQLRYVLLAAPAILFLAVLFGYPVAAMLVRAFNEPTWGLENFQPLVQARQHLEVLGLAIPWNAYLRVFWITLQISLIVTAATLLLGYPVAYVLATLPVSRANLLMIFVLIPFWTSILVRSYAWMVLLGREGTINQALIRLGLVGEPVQLLNTRFAVYVGMIHILLPFMILPLYAVMRSIDRNLLRAAENLGARPWDVFRRVYLPLTLPGIGAGSLVVFILALGFYITPALLGGQRDVTVAVLIAQQVTLINWGFASALALVLLLVALVVFVVFNRLLDVERLYGHRA